MSADAGTVLEEAIAWHLRLADAGADDWPPFIAWLEASPDHAATYDALAAEDAALTAALGPGDWLPRSDLDEDARPDRWWGHWRWGVGGVGAAIAASVTFLLLPVETPDDPLVLQTAPGVRRTARLADGTVVAMNGGTRLLVARDDPRRVTLAQGEALFAVVHDAAHPFEVQSGDVRLRDVGTTFNVVRDRGMLHVQVAEGAVMFAPARERLTLGAGDALALERSGGRPKLSRVAAADVGGWRRNRLSFGATPLATIAAALTRNTGEAVSVSPDLARQTFTGSLSLDGGAAHVVPRLARLLDVEWQHTGHRWVLLPRGHAPH